MNKILALLILTMPLVSWSQTTYVVKPGDTVLKIADQALGNKDRNSQRRYQFAKEIRQLNPDLKNPNALEPGQTLKIPAISQAPAKAVTVPEPAHSSTPPQTHPDAQTPAQNTKLDSAPTDAPSHSPQDTAEIEKPQVEKLPPAQAHQPSAHDSEPSAPAHADKNKAHHSNFFFVQPRYQMLEISSKDEATKAKASMKSKSSVGVDIQYGVILNDQFHLLFQAGLTQTQFKDIEGPAGASVNHTSEDLKYIAAGIAYEATSTLHLDLMLMSTERTFLLPTTGTQYELKAIAVPAAELSLSQDFYSGDSNIFGISAIGEYLTLVKKDSIEYKAALEPFGALYWKSKYGPGSLNYKATLTYKHGHQETSVSEQNEDLMALSLGVYF